MFDNLTPRQSEVATLLNEKPRKPSEVADVMGITESTVRDYISEINTTNENGKYSVGDSEPNTVRETAHGSSTRAAQTRRARNKLEKLEGQLKSLLENTEPLRADGGLDESSGNQDVLIYRTDDHFGGFDEDQYGNTIFNASIAEDRVNQHFDAAFGSVNFRRRAGIDFDTCYIALGGDMLDGEGIHSDQAWEQEFGLGEQIEYVAQVYLKEIKRASTLFDNVVVICQGGNHGEIRLSGGSSPGANADGFVFTTIDLALRYSDIDNVSLLRSDATNYINFQARGHHVHMRHGQGGLGHIGTSSGQQRWGSWLRRHDFDLAMRGHYHQLKYEPVDGKPVLMGGTITPGGQFSESLGVPDAVPQGWVLGVSDRSPTEWMEIVDFK